MEGREQRNQEGRKEADMAKSQSSNQAKKKRGKKAKNGKTGDNAATNSSSSASATFSSTPPAPHAGQQQAQVPSQTATEPKQDPAKNTFSDEARLSTCLGIIHATQKKIVHLRREQFNDIFMEFKQLCEISWGCTKGEMSRLLIGYRDPAISVKLHKSISAFPSEIPVPGLPKTIEILTKATKHMLPDFQDVVTAFSNHQERDAKQCAVARKSFEMMSKVYAAKEAEWKRFDVQIAGLESTISRFQKEIQLIEQGKKWDIDAQKQMIETGKEKTEKLIREM